MDIYNLHQKMKNYTKVFISFILIISAILFTTLLWNKIYLPFNSPLEIVGEYSKQNYSPINDVLRYLIFISFPLLVALFCCIFFIKNPFRNMIKQVSQDDKITENNVKSKKRKIVFFIFLIYIFLEFFSIK